MVGAGTATPRPRIDGVAVNLPSDPLAPRRSARSASADAVAADPFAAGKAVGAEPATEGWDPPARFIACAVIRLDPP